MENQYEPTLYIVMNKEVPDMNPGKGMAQAAHAQALCFKRMNGLPVDSNQFTKFAEWKLSANGFGRTLILEATKSELDNIHSNVHLSGWVLDPTYPIDNYWGHTFTRKEHTCLWAFPSNEKEFNYLSVFDLHP